MDGKSADTSLAEIHQEMSELLENKVNALKESLKKYFRGSRKPTKKCAMKMKQRNKEKKRRTRKNIIDGRRPFIRYAQKIRAMDINQLQIDDC